MAAIRLEARKMDQQEEKESGVKKEKRESGNWQPKKPEVFMDALQSLVQKNPHLLPLTQLAGTKSVIAQATRNSTTSQTSASRPAPPGSKWGALAKVVIPDKKKPSPADEKKEVNERRKRLSQLYTAKRPGVLKLNHKIVSLKEVQSLRDYFDDIDDNGNGVVSLDEIMHHRARAVVQGRQEEKFGESDLTDGLVMTLLREMCEESGDVTFEAMLLRSYPESTKAEIRAAAGAVRKRATKGVKVEDEKEVEDHRQYTKSLEEVAEYWQLFARRTPRKPLGLMSLQEFTNFMNMFEIDNDAEALLQYNSLTNDGRDFLYRDEFTVWWMNYFRNEDLVTWEDIQSEAELLYAEEAAKTEKEMFDSQENEDVQLPEVSRPTNSLMDPNSAAARTVGRSKGGSVGNRVGSEQLLI
eukprot:CAMPEP_0196570750 /NCGR_PEP_ID=MMETSP1081-20130531/905_1 /TAXON_ID=36882 /ORGANISM="Pyramimonas amylifera, Strain CCMP720" /LENGTH=410 /DNA_ID=CAMNT_0041887365 /DNA_START=21 /DNA_END=1253 /DNA_ORIENTATION=-